jgi:hypothetical protein
MKPLIFIASTLLLLSAAGFAQTPTPTPVPPEELRNVPSMDVYQLTMKGYDIDGKIVKIRFDARPTASSKIANKVYGEIGTLHDSTWYNVSVVVPPESEGWFFRIPNTKGGPYSVYGRVSTGSRPPTITLLGREIRTTMHGPELVWTNSR